MHDAVNNMTIMDCYCYGGALSDQASHGHEGEGRAAVERQNMIISPPQQHRLGWGEGVT